jgi:hypothetical protein
LLRAALYYGNADPVLLFVLICGLWLYVHEHSTLSGVLLGLTFVVKPFLGVFALYLVWKRSWKAAFVSILTSGLIFFTSFAPLRELSPNAIVKWLSTMSYEASPAFAAFPYNVSIQGLFLRLFEENPFTIPWFNSPRLVPLLSFAVLSALEILFVTSVSRARDIDVDSSTDRPARVLAESGLLLALLFVASPLTGLGTCCFLRPE